MLYDFRMDEISRRDMTGLTTAAILAPLEAFAQNPDRIPAEIEGKIPPAETIDEIVRNYVRESKGSAFDVNALSMRIMGEDRLAGIRAFEDPEGIVEDCASSSPATPGCMNPSSTVTACRSVSP